MERIIGEFRLKIPNFERKKEKEFDFNGLKIDIGSSKAYLELLLPLGIDKPCSAKIEYLLEETFEKLVNALALVGIGVVGELVSFRHATGACMKIEVTKPISINEQKIKEAKKYLSLLDQLDADFVMKALKWWREGFVENDPVDKFLKFFISFEIFAKNVVGEEQWINKIRCKLKLPPKTFIYDGKQANKIRGDIVHAGKEEAINLAEKYADEFGEDVLLALRKYVEDLIEKSNKKI